MYSTETEFTCIYHTAVFKQLLWEKAENILMQNQKKPRKYPHRTDMVPVGSGKTIIIFKWYNRIPVQTLQKKTKKLISFTLFHASNIPAYANTCACTHTHTHTYAGMIH